MESDDYKRGYEAGQRDAARRLLDAGRFLAAHALLASDDARAAEIKAKADTLIEAGNNLSPPPPEKE